MMFVLDKPTWAWKVPLCFAQLWEEVSQMDRSRSFSVSVTDCVAPAARWIFVKPANQPPHETNQRMDCVTYIQHQRTKDKCTTPSLTLQLHWRFTRGLWEREVQLWHNRSSHLHSEIKRTHTHTCVLING